MFVTTATAGFTSPQTRRKAASSHSMTAKRRRGFPKRLAFAAKSAAMPRSRFEPERLAKQSRPASRAICSSMRQVVVLPFVPVTITVVTPRASRESMSGQTRRAILPGRAVPPLPASRSARRTSLQSNMAKKSLISTPAFSSLSHARRRNGRGLPQAGAQVCSPHSRQPGPGPGRRTCRRP